MFDYEGPKRLKSDVERALCVLGGCLPATVTACSTHCVVKCDTSELNNEDECAIAVYLVGVIASCVDHHLMIRAALFGEENIERDLLSDVAKVIGKDNTISVDFRTKQRDPWIWEGICHLLFHLSVGDSQKHPPDQILAKTCVHLGVKDHGLDVIALYGSTDLGISAGECKAYLNRSADAIRDASTRLAEVDGTFRDAEIRQAIGQFRAGLSPEVQERITDAFWKNERSYFPMVCCDQNHVTDWELDRPTLSGLNRPSDRKFLVPFCLTEAAGFFDRVSDAMRAYCLVSA